MSTTLPKALFSSSHSSFVLINPETDRFHRRLDRHASFTRRHVVISYVWNDWKMDPSDRLPHWPSVRERLLSVLGGGPGPAVSPAAASSPDKLLQAETGRAKACWIDCRCIDQDSETDKQYWIPRMDEVYSEARCTILLLRHDDLGALQGVARTMTCPYKGKFNGIDELLGPHDCLLSQHCTSLSPEVTSDPALERACVESLLALARGVWRRRAWILQEILLSRNYILSWGTSTAGEGWVRLADVGIVAGLMSRRCLNPDHRDVPTEFSTWCRRLWYLRQNYAGDHEAAGPVNMWEPCDGNILQLAAGLEATMPADKFYALCGILRVKQIKYNSSHSANEAFQNVVSELVRNGRLSWLYSVRPQLSLDDETWLKGDDAFAPFILTRLDERLSPNRHTMYMAGGTLGFKAVKIGRVTAVQPLREYLSQAVAHFRDHGLANFTAPDRRHLLYAPAVIRRLALEILDPLMTLRAVFDSICEALAIGDVEAGSSSRSFRLAVLVMTLYSLEDGGDERIRGDDEVRQMIIGASFSLRNYISLLMDTYSVVTVSFLTRDPSKDPRLPVLIGFPTAVVDSAVFSVVGDKSLIFCSSEQTPPPMTGADISNHLASDRTEEPEGSHAEFRGMLTQLNVRESIGPAMSSLSIHRFGSRLAVPQLQRSRVF